MKKTFKIEVDCANCANLIEAEIQKMDRVQSATISFMTQKMKLEFDDAEDIESIKADILKVARKIEPDFEIL